MSLYLVNKFIWQVDADPDWFADFLDDPAGFLAWWEREEGPKVTRTETVSAHEFTDEERTALIEKDAETLYKMGVHPFILFTWIIPMWEEELGSMPEVMKTYRELVAPFGRPSWQV